MKGRGGKKSNGDEHRKRDEEVDGVDELLEEHGGVVRRATVPPARPTERGNERYRVRKEQDDCCETKCKTKGCYLTALALNVWIALVTRVQTHRCDRAVVATR